jgi:hypothetical protein
VNNDVLDPAWEVLREKSRKLYPTRVVLQSNRPETMFNRVDWIQANAPVRGGDEQRMLVARGRDTVNLYSNPMRLEASITGPNAIDIRATNVDTARLYLSADMVDFSKPISITWNRRTTEIEVKPDLQIMLRDQLLLGRGWRGYVAIVDLPLDPQPPAANADE